MNLDLDSLDSATVNRFDWVITPRDAAASVLPAQLELVRATRDFALYRRNGLVAPRGTLAEGDVAAAVLDCDSREGRTLLRTGGVATIRDAMVSVAGPQLAPGASATVTLQLTPGRWDIVASYVGSRPIQAAAPGLWTTLPASLDRPGTRWPVGRVDVSSAGPVNVTLRSLAGRWTSPSAITTFGPVTAVPVGTQRTVPVAKACGKLVDHYEEAAG